MEAVAAGCRSRPWQVLFDDIGNPYLAASPKSLLPGPAACEELFELGAAAAAAAAPLKAVSWPGQAERAAAAEASRAESARFREQRLADRQQSAPRSHAGKAQEPPLDAKVAQDPARTLFVRGLSKEVRARLGRHSTDRSRTDEH